LALIITLSHGPLRVPLLPLAVIIGKSSGERR
jgi:hypothetical protein